MLGFAWGCGQLKSVTHLADGVVPQEAVRTRPRREVNVAVGIVNAMPLGSLIFVFCSVVQPAKAQLQLFWSGYDRTINMGLSENKGYLIWGGSLS